MSPRPRSNIPATLRRELRELQDGRCAYCDSPGNVVDHVIPVAWNGPDDRCNMVLSCRACNQAKGKSFDLEWLSRGIRALFLIGRDTSWIDDYRFPWQEKADDQLEREFEDRTNQ